MIKVKVSKKRVLELDKSEHGFPKAGQPYGAEQPGGRYAYAGMEENSDVQELAEYDCASDDGTPDTENDISQLEVGTAQDVKNRRIKIFINEKCEQELQYDLLELEENTLEEKKDRCYKLAKRKYKVFPSAYASGFIVRCRKGKVAKKRKKKNESMNEEEGLKKWFDRQGEPGKGSGWVDCNTCRTNPETGRKTCKSCGRKEGEKRSKYPACRPSPSKCTKAGTSKKKSSKRVSWKSDAKKD